MGLTESAPEQSGSEVAPALAIARSTGNKAEKIANFLPEKVKEWLQKKREETGWSFTWRGWQNIP